MLEVALQFDRVIDIDPQARQCVIDRFSDDLADFVFGHLPASRTETAFERAAWRRRQMPSAFRSLAHNLATSAAVKSLSGMSTTPAQACRSDCGILAREVGGVNCRVVEQPATARMS